MDVYAPSLNDQHLAILEKKIGADYESIEVDCDFIANEKKNDCFNVVDRHIEKYGGRRILGWQIWKTSTMIQAEAHAVWEDTDNTLLDISPKENIITDKIVFIEDSRFEYRGKQINNIRLNITDNILVDQLIQLFDLFFYAQNKGDRANFANLENMLSTEEINKINEIIKLRHNLALFIQSGADITSLCYCGKQKKYKECCGKNFTKKLKKLKMSL